MKKPLLTQLFPTQFSLGMREVDAKLEKMGKMSKRELRAYCDRHTIPLVRGPGKGLYLIDHHHFARACWEFGTDLYSVHVIEDFSHLTPKMFWRQMTKKRWVFLSDQFGGGPHSPLALPQSIRGMADDPYRSLAWMLIQESAIDKSDVPFFEFSWASFLRLHLKTPLYANSEFGKVLREAKALAKNDLSLGLPGRLIY